MSIITLTTDFGTSDWFVGTMKGVILGINPRAQMVDVTHGIAQGDVSGGAYALMAAAPYFPKGTIHVVVVDPGVGSDRKALAVQTDRATFIAPDNGVLWWTLRQQTIRSVRQITNQSLFVHPVSQTFHGRDIFAPTAAHLSRKFAFPKVGPALDVMKTLDWPEPQIKGGQVTGEVVYIDRFGNAITNIPHSTLTENQWLKCQVLVGRKKLGSPRASYAEVTSGKPLAILSSSGNLEIAVRNGPASQQLRLTVGSKVTLHT